MPINQPSHVIPTADAPFDIVWDNLGVAHIYATTVADAYRGMGYAAASERLWQIHLSTAYANGEAAALLGERFVGQDLLQRACNVHGGDTPIPDSPGDWIVDAYLEGTNAFVSALDEVPPEFRHAGTEPRPFTRADVAARYRFTSWFQHKSWTEKIVLGRLMATHGVDWFRHHVLHFSRADEDVVETLRGALRGISTAALPLAYPTMTPGALAGVAATAGSNNWAITGALSASGKPMLATDPHQPHSIPNTFFYAHLHAGDWDAFGAAFPGVPYFMMGYNRDVAWGLTTGFVDSYDVYVERVRNVEHSSDQQFARGEVQAGERWDALTRKQQRIAIKGGGERVIHYAQSRHGPLLDSLCGALGIQDNPSAEHQLALRWALADEPTSAGALARLPLAKTAEEFGELLFEDDICPLVNNIICIDRDNHLRRFIATTLPARQGVTGSVPLPGWDARYDFRHSTADELVVEIDPPHGYAYTANNDTMGERGDYPIHNFPTHSARADRINELLQQRPAAGFSMGDFEAMQLDQADLRAIELVPDLVDALAGTDDEDVALAHQLLSAWDCCPLEDASAPCLFYPFLDRFWAGHFMTSVLHDPLIKVLPTGAPGLNRFDIQHFFMGTSPWRKHRPEMLTAVRRLMKETVVAVRAQLGDDPTAWAWGDLHQVEYWHSLAKHDQWAHMRVGPDPVGGSGTSLAMAAHMGPGPGRAKDGEVACRVYVGPAFRLVVDLADPAHASFVIGGGNGGRADSPFLTNHYASWLHGDYHPLVWDRDEIIDPLIWSVSNQRS